MYYNKNFVVEMIKIKIILLNFIIIRGLKDILRIFLEFLCLLLNYGYLL